MKTSDNNEFLKITALLNEKLTELESLEKEKEYILSLANDPKNHNSELTLKMANSLQKYEALVAEIKSLKQQASKIN